MITQITISDFAMEFRARPESVQPVFNYHRKPGFCVGWMCGYKEIVFCTGSGRTKEQAKAAAINHLLELAARVEKLE